MWYRFWLKSGRGTDEQTYKWLDYDEKKHDDKEEIKAELEHWCSRFACWEMSESYMRYGFNKVKSPPIEFLERRLKGATAGIDIAKREARFFATLLDQFSPMFKEFL